MDAPHACHCVSCRKSVPVPPKAAGVEEEQTCLLQTSTAKALLMDPSVPACPKCGHLIGSQEQFRGKMKDLENHIQWTEILGIHPLSIGCCLAQNWDTEHAAISTANNSRSYYTGLFASGGRWGDIPEEQQETHGYFGYVGRNKQVEV